MNFYGEIRKISAHLVGKNALSRAMDPFQKGLGEQESKLDITNVSFVKISGKLTKYFQYPLTEELRRNI